MGSLEPLGLPQALYQQVRLSKTTIAVKSDEQTLTFEELHLKALYLAHQILSKGLPVQSPIAVLSPRGINHIMSQVAVIYAGGYCVPLDIRQPDGYLDKLLSRLRCRLVITDPERQERLSQYDHLVANHEEISTQYQAQTAETVISSNGPDALTHIFHTSGTTGTPKAVQLQAEGLMSRAYQGIHPIMRGERFAQVSNITFDASLLDIWVPLLGGATVVIIPQDVLLDPKAFCKRLRSEMIDTMFLTSALLTSTANVVPKAFATIRTLMTGGEVMNMQTIKTIFENGPPQRLYNIYGPTETTIYCLYHLVLHSDVKANSVPLGRTVPNITVHVVDENLQPVARGEVGELLVQGSGVSRGYAEDPEKTAKAFVHAPHLADTTLYRTGDLMRVNEAGLYEFIGRRDNQVKIRGQRIELEAVEHLLRETGLVLDAAVLKVQPEDSTVGAILLAYVIPSSDTTNANTIVREFVQRTPHMVPRIEFIDAFPLGPTGKVDRKRLEKQYLEKMAKVARSASLCKTGQVPRKSSYPEILVHLEALWLEILRLPVAGLDPSDDFFYIGGTSLQAATLVARVRQAFAVELQSAELYEYSTLDALARLILALQTGTQSDDGHEKLEAVWKQDGELGKNLMPIGGTVPDWKAPGEGRVFLTGVTGFVGAFLLYELLKMPQVSRVACLIRAKDTTAGLARLRKNLDKYRIELEPGMEKRILIVPGDFAQPYLGLTPDEYDLFAGWASVVFHLGAQVNYVQPYSTHRNANVIGTLRMLEFANYQRPKMLHYSSSIAAYGPSGFVLGAKYLAEDERPREYMRALHYDTGYSQSQMVAECVVWNAIDNGLPVAIYRPGFVLGHSKSGISNPDDFVGRLFSSCLAMGSYPVLPAQRKEFIPVDFVVGALLHIAANPARLGHAYNLVQPRREAAIDLITTFEMLDSLTPLKMKPLPYSKWVERFSFKTQDPLHPLMPMLREKVLGELTRWEVQEQMATFGVDNLREALQDAPDVLNTEPMSILFKQYIRQWLPEGYRT
ncbi:putative NRPS-like protein biosynthetic cluster [Aspergillus brasiliensis]|nr:putative NRPS-like protein biosynthetic cluster [Aspergillus brasiliensis]